MYSNVINVTDPRCPAGDEEAWQAQQDDRAAQLHRKLMSPERHRRRTPLEIQRGMEAKLARAQHRREEMGSKMRRRMAQAEAGRQVGAWGVTSRGRRADTDLAEAPLCAPRSTVLIHGSRLLRSLKGVHQLE